MKELELAAAMLELITEGGKNFQDAIKEVFPANSAYKQYQGSVCAFVGCELRHYNLIKEVSKNIELDAKKACVLYLGIANNAFLKRFNDEEMKSEVKSILGDAYVPEIDVIFDNTADLMQLCKEYEVDSPEYISVRFNTPRWLVKMWQKHYGRALTFKILRKNNRQQIHHKEIHKYGYVHQQKYHTNHPYKMLALQYQVCE